MTKMRNKLIIILIVFSVVLISIVILLFYINLSLKVNGFTKLMMEKNQTILLDMLDKSKKDAKDIILQSNSKVVDHTKEKINEFMKRVSKGQSYTILRLMNLTIEKEIKEIESLVNYTANSAPFYWQYEAKERESLSGIMEKNNTFLGMMVFNELGENSVKIGDFFNRIDIKSMLAVTRGRGIYYSGLEKDNSYIVAVPIINDEQKYKGALVARISFKTILENVYDKVNISSEKTVFVLNDMGMIIKHKNREMEYKYSRLRVTDSTEFQQIVEEKNNRIYNILGYNSNLKFYTLEQVAISDSFSYIDVIKSDAEKTIEDNYNSFDKHLKEQVNIIYERNKIEGEKKLEAFAKELMSVLYFIVIISVCIAIFIGVILANYITNPIKELSTATKNIGNGDLDIKIRTALILRNDEIGMLAKEFSDMQLKLKKDIEHIKELERKKAHSERLSVVGEMASGIVHEIKNPLTSISGFAQIINEITDNELIKNHSKIIMDETDRLNKLTLELLDYAKVKKLEVDRIDIKSLIEGSVEKLKPKMAVKNMTATLDIPAALPFLFGDRNKLTQVVINIVSNSIEAMNRNVEGEIVISAKELGEKIILSFRDNGPGIPESIREKIFIPFTSSKKNGTGLGLSIVKKIIDDHLGEIFVKTSPNYGTEFIIKLYINLKIEE